jgi:hypothetical protein
MCARERRIDRDSGLCAETTDRRNFDRRTDRRTDGRTDGPRAAGQTHGVGGGGGEDDASVQW